VGYLFTFLIILTGTSGLPFTRADLLPAVPHKEEKVKAMTEDAEPIRSKMEVRRDTTAVFFMLNTLAALNDARNVPIIGTSIASVTSYRPERSLVFNRSRLVFVSLALQVLPDVKTAPWGAIGPLQSVSSRACNVLSDLCNPGGILSELQLCYEQF